MKLRMASGRLRLGAAFRAVAAGYLVGAGVIALCLFAATSTAVFVFGVPAWASIAVTNDPARWGVAALALAAILVIVALQALMVASVVTFGLWLYRQWRPLRILIEGV